MKIATIGMQIKGGAGLSSLKLHEEFKRQGHDARFFVGKQTFHQDKVELIPTKKSYKHNWWTLGTVPIKESLENIVSSGFSGKEVSYLNNVRDWADVILLRWVTATVSDWQIACWSNQEKPLVWCLSDMAPLTGGCHYSRGCTKYESGCFNCGLVRPDMSQYPSLVLERRRRLWGNISVVSPSKWLANIACHSLSMMSKDVRIIKTGVELDIFKPTEREYAKKLMGISNNKITLLFGADSTKDERKGYELLAIVLEKLKGKGLSDHDIQLILFGNGKKESLNLPFRTTYLGQVTSKQKMSVIYSAADMSVLPYKEDNMPNVMLESIACGTPVVAFNVGGMSDIIHSGVNGQLAIPYDTNDFTNCILKLIDTNLSQNDVRKWAVRNIDIKTQASNYIKFFNELVNQQFLSIQ